MGQSTNAILIWGIDFEGVEEGKEYPIFEDEEFEEIREDLLYNPWNKDSSNLTMVIHCHCEYPMYIIGILSTFKEASRGYAVEFDQFPETKDEHLIIEFCEKYKLPYSQPRWILASYWC